MSILVFSTTSLSSGTAGIAYSNAVVATGGITPYTYSASGLPNGLALNPTTGAITGTPSLLAVGSYSVIFSVVDSAPTAETTPTTISLTINPPPLQDAITLGYIEEDLTLTLAWNPAAVNGGYSAYNDWNIWLISASNPTDPLLQSVGGNLPTGLEFGGTLSSRSFRTTVSLDGYSVKMQALSADPDYTNASGWANYLSFPSVFTDSSVAVDLTTAQINQPVLISLSSIYTGASQWRLVFSTGAATAWLPISVQTINHIFTTSGAVTFSVEVQNDYSTVSPAVQLRRSITKSIFVSNSVWVPTQASSEIITGTVGMYGNTGFEITEALAGGVPEPYAVIMRSLVRDTVTNELKLLVALSRYQNASSILGTMVADVFPLIGRPQVQDLMDITPTLSVQSNSSSSPVVINYSSLPLVNAVTPEIEVIAGLPMGEISFTASGGIAPYSWYAADLPYGLKFSIDGTLSGTPMVLGIYQSTFSVSDSSNPEFIDTIVVAVAVRSNLAISTTGLSIVNGNVYLPSAQVMASYSYQMLNTGGIAPFTWSVAPGSGGLPDSMIVNSVGLVSGYPTTDNSTTDFTTPFFATIQVSDALGAIALQYFGIDLTPANLTLDTSQLPVVFAGETFRIGLGIFGGVGPYTVVMTDGTGITSSGALIDGRWEFLLIPTVNSIGIQTLSFLVTDSAANTANLSVNYTVGLQVANVGLYNPIVEHLWESGDTTTVSLPFDSSNLNGLTLDSYSATSTNGISITLTSGDLVFQQTVSPSTFGSTNDLISVPILAAGNQVATVSHEYTVENSNSTLAVVGGNLSSSTIPYLVGNLVA